MKLQGKYADITASQDAAQTQLVDFEHRLS